MLACQPVALRPDETFFGSAPVHQTDASAKRCLRVLRNNRREPNRERLPVADANPKELQDA